MPVKEVKTSPGQQDVLRCQEIDTALLAAVMRRFQLSVAWCPAGAGIPGSFWGEPEAGLVGHRLYLRPDTPVHSALHEACHFICMAPARRAALHTDAGGGYDEENAVCYLQILLADWVPGMGQARMCNDMDRWGYTFRLGSARRWFLEDAAEARQWLYERGLIHEDGGVSFKLRM